MRILVVCQYYYPEPFRITDICEQFVKNGHEVTVLTGLPNYPEGEIHKDYQHKKNRSELINGVNIKRTFEFGRGKSKVNLALNYLSFAISSSLYSLFLKNTFDSIFVYQLSPITMCIPAIILKKKYNKKLIIYCLDLWPESILVGRVKRSSLFYKFTLSLSKFIYSSADKIAVTSEMFIDYFINTLGIPSDKLLHIPQYAEDIFTKSNKSNRKKENTDDIYNLLFAGNIGEFQSVETIILTANQLKNYENIIFHIVGDGSKLEYCKTLALELKLSNVIFYGRRSVEEMPYFYNFADAMLLTLKNSTNISYTLPGKVQSYLAFGKPILGSINGEGRNLIEKSNCGYVCSAEDYNGFSKIIIDFINNKIITEMSINSFKYYNENFTKEIFFKRIETIL